MKGFFKTMNGYDNIDFNRLRVWFRAVERLDVRKYLFSQWTWHVWNRYMLIVLKMFKNITVKYRVRAG